ncbi:WapI family immunity protein [Myroides sp. LJL116]
MIQFSNDRFNLALTILGYAYPFTKEDWDANWLEMKISLNDYFEGSFFENKDTCILTIEMERLKVWLEQIINDPGSSKKKEISFIEPNLSFRYRESILQIVLNMTLIL